MARRAVFFSVVWWLLVGESASGWIFGLAAIPGATTIQAMERRIAALFGSRLARARESGSATGTVDRENGDAHTGRHGAGLRTAWERADRLVRRWPGFGALIALIPLALIALWQLAGA